MTWCWRPPPYFSLSLCRSFDQWNRTTCALWVLASLVICASVSSRGSLAPAAVWYASYDSVTIRLFAYYTAEQSSGLQSGAVVTTNILSHIHRRDTYTRVCWGYVWEWHAGLREWARHLSSGPRLPPPSAVRECRCAHLHHRYAGGYLVLLSCPFLINDNADHPFLSVLATGYSFKGLFSSFAQQKHC